MDLTLVKRNAPAAAQNDMFSSWRPLMPTTEKKNSRRPSLRTRRAALGDTTGATTPNGAHGHARIEALEYSALGTSRLARAFNTPAD